MNIYSTPEFWQLQVLEQQCKAHNAAQVSLGEWDYDFTIQPFMRNHYLVAKWEDTDIHLLAYFPLIADLIELQGEIEAYEYVTVQEWADDDV